MQRTLITASLAVCAALAFAGSASAESGLKIDRSGLDLNRAEDVAEFEVRLDKAAGAYCRKQGAPTGTRMGRVSECKASVREAVLRSLPAAEREAIAQAPRASKAG